MTDRQLQFLKYLDGELGEEEFADLCAWMCSDPEHAAELAKLAVLDVHLREKFGFDDFIDSDAPPAAAATPDRDAPRIPMIRKAVRFFTRPTPLSISVAALFIGLLITAMAFIAAPIYRHLASPGLEPGELAPPVVVARLTGTKEAVWVEGQIGARRGALLVAGHRMELISGLAEVTYHDGARVILEGPAMFTVEGLGAGRIDAGKLVAKVPEEAHGYTVSTRLGRVIDLGTEFAIEAYASGEADIYVIDGGVEVSSDGTHAGQMSTRLSAGDAVRISRSGGNAAIEVIAFTADRFVREAPVNKPRSITIVNHSFEQPVLPDSAVARHRPDGDFDLWRTPPGWRWTDKVPEFGGLANPSIAGDCLLYANTEGDGRNGFMHGSQVLFFGDGVAAGEGIEQDLEEQFAAGTFYDLRVAAGVRQGSRNLLGGRILLLAGETVLTQTSLPADAPGLFRDYRLLYRYDPAHSDAVGQRLKIQLLREDEHPQIDFDNVRLYVLVEE